MWTSFGFYLYTHCIQMYSEAHGSVKQTVSTGKARLLGGECDQRNQAVTSWKQSRNQAWTRIKMFFHRNQQYILFDSHGQDVCLGLFFKSNMQGWNLCLRLSNANLDTKSAQG
ncbi:unnamed protein product [Durusdinium trenchii]|uniref:Uncharacterized protein n=1 Tax=Durusdinium trenchii TaxID=1381693 RepID=A0ABP0HAL9_9DINO